jgi:hypothetical protein
LSRSLKWFTPGLARLLQTTAPRLYEREQMLIRGRLLDFASGRGPGSGVRGTGPAVTLLIIAALAAETLKQTEDRTREIADAVLVGPEEWPFTGRRRFQDALHYFLTSRFWSSRVIEVTVSRTAARATIVYRDPKTRERYVSEFTGPNDKEPPIKVSVTIDGAVIKQIANDIADVLQVVTDSSDDEHEVKWLALGDEEAVSEPEPVRRERGVAPKRSVRETR